MDKFDRDWILRAQSGEDMGAHRQSIYDAVYDHESCGNWDVSMALRAIIPSENVKEHAPLSAGARVDHGVEVETTEEHENRAADRGCCVSSCSPSDYQDKAAQNDSFNRGPSLEVSIDKSGGSVSATGATIASSRVIGILDGPSGGVAGSRAVNPRSVVTVNLMVGEHPSLGIGGDTDIPVGVGIATDALHVGINLGDDFGVGHRIDLVLRFLANVKGHAPAPVERTPQHAEGGDK
jgi:hypothetical protein